jgi:5-methylcytosine-specific restriction endonuclease McrA
MTGDALWAEMLKYVENSSCDIPLQDSLDLKIAPKQRWAQHRERARQIRTATPPWADSKEISMFYCRAQTRTQNTGIEHVVDHMIPIKHPLVCGLHTPANLRVITLVENARKHNRWHRNDILEDLVYKRRHTAISKAR